MLDLVPARRPPLRTLLALSLASLASLGLGGCKTEEPSNLEKMAEDSAAEGQPAEGVTPTLAKPDDPQLAGDVPPIPESDLPLDGDGLPIPATTGAAKLISPGAEDQRIELRLALAADARYRITTIGMLKLPLFDKPIGFAREEDLRLGDCQGEGLDRSCLITHNYRNFEAEPPTGDALEKDEALVAKLETSHRIDASGLRLTETAVNGAADNPAAQTLSQVHRMYCVRLPSEPVGIGATWRDTCRTRIGGQIVTRELVWRLAKIESTEEGTRAELEYAGRVRRVDPEGAVQTGEIKGGLLFWVDAGEPHVMRERVAFILDAKRGLSTGTDLRYQFAKLGANDELIRTDGKPFEHSPVVLNEPRSVPIGETRDGELPANPKRDKKPK